MSLRKREIIPGDPLKKRSVEKMVSLWEKNAQAIETMNLWKKEVLKRWWVFEKKDRQVIKTKSLWKKELLQRWRVFEKKTARWYKKSHWKNTCWKDGESLQKKTAFDKKVFCFTAAQTDQPHNVKKSCCLEPGMGGMGGCMFHDFWVNLWQMLLIWILICYWFVFDFFNWFFDLKILNFGIDFDS